MKFFLRFVKTIKHLFNSVFDLFFPKDIEQDEFSKNFFKHKENKRKK